LNIGGNRDSRKRIKQKPTLKKQGGGGEWGVNVGSGNWHGYSLKKGPPDLRGEKKRRKSFWGERGNKKPIREKKERKRHRKKSEIYWYRKKMWRGSLPKTVRRKGRILVESR